MVSVAGYVVAEYVMLILGSYVLLAITIISQAIVATIREDSVVLSVIKGIGVFVALYVLYLFDFRIGTVMLINGMILMKFLMNVIEIVKYFLGDGDDQETEYEQLY